MDKNKSSKSGGGGGGAKKPSHLHPSACDLIALGVSKTGSGGSSATGGSGSSSNQPRPIKSSSSMTTSGSSSSSKRDSGSGSVGGPPPAKKIRISPPRTTTSSTSSSHHHQSSSSSSSSKSGKIRRDPLELTPSSTSSAAGPVISSLELTTEKFFTLMEKANKSNNAELAQNVLQTGLKRLRSINAKEKEQLQICQNILIVVKMYPHFFKTVPIMESLVALVQPKVKDVTGVKAKLLGGGGAGSSAPFAVFALTLVYLVYCHESHWPVPLVNLWMEDASGDRSWVESTLLKPIVDNMLYSFGTLHPLSSLLPASDIGGGGSGGGSSPNPLSGGGSGGDDPTGSGNLTTELEQLIKDNNDLMEVDVPLRNRYSGLEENVEGLILEYTTELVHKKSPDIPRHLLKALSSCCGLGGVRSWVVSRIEQWLHNGKLSRVAQELLLHLCVNSNCNTASDIEVISNISKLRMKTKPLTHFYCIALREMVRENIENMRHVLNLIIYNELSPQRNPNNLPILGTILAGVPDSRAALADIFIELLQKREDFHPAMRLLLREIVRSARFECDLSKFVEGLIKQRDITWLGECRERAFLAIADLVLLSMFLSVSPQVREAAAVAAVRGEVKDTSTLVNFRNLLSGIQSDACTWMYSVVPKMYRPVKANFLISLNKIFLKDPVSDLATKDGWPPESEKNMFGRLCLEVGLQESSLVFVLMMGVSKDHPLSASEALDTVEQIICRAAAHKTGLNLQKIEIIELLFRLSEYRHPDNISLPQGYEAPKMAVSNFYWRAWALLCVISAFNPNIFGRAGWEDYPTLKTFMEMCMTNSFIFPTASTSESESSEEIISRELQTVAMEKEEILEFETHLAAASSKTTITEATSLLLKQLMRLDPFGPPRHPPPWILTQLQAWNDQMLLGHHLCGSRNPDFLLDLIQRNSEPMPWLARLVSEGSFEILPDQCLCEFLMGRMEAVEKALTLSRSGEESIPGRSPKKGSHSSKGGLTTPAAELGLGKEDVKLLQLLHYLQEKVHSSSEDGEARKVLEYFLKRLSAPKMQQRNQALNALKLLLIKEDETCAATSASDDWLLDGLPSLAVFSEIQENVLVLLRQAILIENDPSLLCSYLEFLSTWAQVSEDLEGLALDVANLVVERNGLVCLMMNRFSACFHALFDIFFTFMKIRGPHKESYKWCDSQDQVLVTWPLDRLEGTMNILIIHAIVILLSSYSGSKKVTHKNNKDVNIRSSELLDIWFPQNKDNSPKGFLLNTSEEAVLFPDWVKLKMIRSNNSRLLQVATQDLEVEQLLLFVQHFGVPVQSMTALLYITDTFAERDPDKLVRCVANASFLYKLIQAQWKRGAVGGEKFVHLLKTRCGVVEQMDIGKEDDDDDDDELPRTSVRSPLHFGTVKEPKKGGVDKISHARIHTGSRVPPLNVGLPMFSTTPSNKRKSIELLSKELLHLSSPPSNRRRSSVPASKAGLDAQEGGVTPRRHSAHLEEKRKLAFGKMMREGEDDETGEKNPSKYLGQLVDQITQVEPCIVRNALEYQLPLLFGKNENSSGCRSYLMTALAHQAGWETINQCLTLFLKEFDPTYDPSSILDLIQATHSNPKLFQGVDKYVPKHQPNISVMHLTSEQLGAMADYIIEEISQTEMKSTKFSISNLLGPSQSSTPPSSSTTSLKKSKQGLQSRIRLWLQCAQQDKVCVDSVISGLMDKKWRNPCVKRFIHQVYIEFPEVILIENWRWKAEDMSVSEDEISSLLDSISHGLITALANTQPGKEWAKKGAREYEICLRKLASLHPTLLLRQISLMGSLLEGRVHLESLAFHQQNHNLPFIVFLSLFDLMQPHILRHFTPLKATFLLYFKMFKNYGTTKDYSSSLSRFSILLHNFLSLNSQEVKDFLSPHYALLRELSTLKYYLEVVPLQNLISCLDPLSGSGAVSSNAASTGGGNTPPVVTPTGDFLAPLLISMHDRLLHASNDEETIPVLQELDACSNRNPSILNKFSENLNLLLKSESESCRTLAFSLVLKHSTYFPGQSATYLDSILQLLEDENAHLRDTMMDRVHEFVILAQERGEDILNRMFELGISSNVNFLAPIQKSMALLRNYSSLAFA